MYRDCDFNESTRKLFDHISKQCVDWQATFRQFLKYTNQFDGQVIGYPIHHDFLQGKFLSQHDECRTCEEHSQYKVEYTQEDTMGEDDILSQSVELSTKPAHFSRKVMSDSSSLLNIDLEEESTYVFSTFA